MTKAHPDAAQDIALIRAITVKTDPSVHCDEMTMKGEPLGSVPMDRTMAKPKAYHAPKKGS